MHSFFTALLLVAYSSLAITATTHVKRGICDIENNQAAQDACGMQKAFAGSSIYPQVLNVFSPQAALYVNYQNIIVGGAQQLTPKRVSAKPNLSISFAQGPQTSVGARLRAARYALLVVDYQPQGRVAKAIWVESGMRVDRNTGQLTSTAAPIKSYQSPNPARGTGTHSYVFLVFEETRVGLAAYLQRNASWRNQLVSRAFDVKSFLAQSNLQNSLVAGSFFKSTFA